MRRSIWLPAVVVAGFVAAAGGIWAERQEIAPGVAVDRAKVLSTTDSVRVTMGRGSA
jgi:hypothetical protein